MTASKRPMVPPSTAVPSLAEPDLGPAPGAAVARDMVRRGLLILPVVVATTWLIADGAVAASVAFGFGLILANFLLSAYLLAFAARISLGLVASVALGGYVMRLALIFTAVWLVRDTSWVRMIPLGMTIIATHLGLLVWELRHVSATMAHPGLKPAGGRGLLRRGSRPAAGYRPDRNRNRADRSPPRERNNTGLHPTGHRHRFADRLHYRQNLEQHPERYSC